MPTKPWSTKRIIVLPTGRPLSGSNALHEIIIEIDWDKLFRGKSAALAAKNKSHRSQLAHGAIVFRAKLKKD
jgi:hypothetical protein